MPLRKVDPPMPVFVRMPAFLPENPIAGNKKRFGYPFI
jgi:hypothetical protein